MKHFRRIRCLPRIALLFLVLSTTLSARGPEELAHKPVFVDAFDKPPREGGWEALKPEKVSKQDGKNLNVTGSSIGGGWLSPHFPATPGALFHVQFRSRAEHKAYWGLNSFDATGEQIPGSVCSGTYASDDWVENHFVAFTPVHANGKSRLIFWPIKGAYRIDDVRVTPCTKKEGLAYVDQLYKQLPPIQYEPPAKRWEGLPQTFAKLRAGKPICIVVIGDSVANDLANSLFQLLVERDHKGTPVKLVNAVVGSAGAGYFLEGDRLKQHVVRFKPDLVIMTGISHGHKVEPVRQLAAAVGKACPADFLFATDQQVHPRYWDQRQDRPRQIPPKRTAGFREGVRAAGAADGFAVFDLGGAWDEYILKSAKPVEWYRRDGHHNNDRGKQILARLTARYLSFVPGKAVPAPKPAAAGPAAEKPGKRKRRVFRATAKLEARQAALTPEQAQPYKTAYYAAWYRVTKTKHGKLKDKRICVIVRSLQNGKMLPAADYKPGARQHLKIALWRERPDHENQRVVTDPDDRKMLDATQYELLQARPAGP